MELSLSWARSMNQLRNSVLDLTRDTHDPESAEPILYAMNET